MIEKKSKRVLEYSNALLEKIKKYSHDERVWDYATKVALIMSGAGGTLLLRKGIVCLCRAEPVFKDGMIGESPGKVIVGKNYKQIEVRQQEGCTCGYNAVKNSILIVNALRKKQHDLQDQLQKPQDDLFVSKSHPEYKNGKRGFWRQLVEIFRSSDSQGKTVDKTTSDYLDCEEFSFLTDNAKKCIADFESNFYIVNNRALKEDKPAMNTQIDNYLGDGRTVIIMNDQLKSIYQNFKNDKQQIGLPLIVNVNGNHWIADVLYKEHDGSITHIVADSMNCDRLNSPEIKALMDITAQ
jgi:hypothetical protein